MDKRSLFYWSRDFSKSLEKGQNYLELPAVININIVNFEFLDIDDFHASFHLWEDRNRECMLSEALEIHFLDMVKFRRLHEKDIVNNPLHRWLTFFDKNTNDKILKEVIKMDTAIQKAQERITFVSQDKESLRDYDMREMALSDYTSGMNFARREGRQEGHQEGRQEGIAIGEERGITIGEKRGEKKAVIKYAIKLFQRGMNVVEIADITDLNMEEVKEIVRNIQQ
jgi:predicted transposase/invertase (TIGR01784 family)